MICDGDGRNLIDAIKTDEPVPISVTVSSGNDEDAAMATLSITNA
jgi:hypothetical protein